MDNFRWILVGTVLASLLLNAKSAISQISPDPVEKEAIQFQIGEFLKDQASHWSLTEEDIYQFEVIYAYTSRHNGVIHAYIQQSIDGTPVDQTVTTLTITPEGKTHALRVDFIPNVRELVEEFPLLLTPGNAIIRAAHHLNIAAHPSQLKALQTTRSRESVFEAAFSDENITVKPIYAFNQSGKLRLAWDLSIMETQGSDYWNVKIDGHNGELLDKNNYTVYCNQTSISQALVRNCDHDQSLDVSGVYSFAPPGETEQNNLYKVYPFPFESPSEGPHTIVHKPHLPIASPFGWHDINGVEGPEYTITRGNNTHAYQNRHRNNASNGDEPNGGEDLIFVFDHKLNDNSDSSEYAAITNLFYANNMIHDLSYLLGFTEEAGNFQQNNYGKGGRAADYVIAQGFDGNARNNAAFTTPPDGSRGRMQMFLWDKVRSLLTIDQPATLSERVYEFGTANFGPNIQNVNISAPIVVARDNSVNPTAVCSNVVTNLSGKIAMVDRGLCDFSQKVFNAQQRGAVMVMVCNVAGVGGGTGDELISMGAGENANLVNIPSIFMKKRDCDLIRIALNNGEEVIATVKDRPIQGPRDIDGNFDNGVILHEYAHGISIRLTGGPLNASCLINYDTNGDGRRDAGEQMGEGWSDFFGLIFTTKPGDNGAQPRGIGTYVSGAPPTARGIRTFPYSTDMTVNPLTYDFIKTASVPHGVGAVWTAMIWDLYWAFIDLYGFDPDWSNTRSGNYMSTLLVMDGMKIQPCNPGFVDGRDAILEADRINYNGKHQRLIWEVFARRGLGYYADQGEPRNHRDGKEDFEIPPLLIEELKIAKSSNRNIRPGDLVDVQISVTNHIPSTQSGIIVQDQLPEGLTFLVGSSNKNAEVQGNHVLFQINRLLYEETDTITYQAISSVDIKSTTFYYDDVESSQSQWKTESAKTESPWRISTREALSGSRSWYVEERNAISLDERLTSPPITILGMQRPVFRFWHKYDIMSAENGGFIEIKEAGSEQWNEVAEYMIIRNYYPGQLSFFTFAIPFLEGFSGNSDNLWKDTYIDLSDYNGKTIQIRFRFGTDGGTRTGVTNPGWFIDEMEVLDLKKYESRACVSSHEAPELRCSPISTIVINGNTVTQVENLIPTHKTFKVFPNPANDVVYIESSGEYFGESRLLVHSVDGQLVIDQKWLPSTQIAVSTAGLQSGIYFFKVIEGDSIHTEKVIITH